MMKCWICIDVGFIQHYQKFKIRGKILEYTITLHCSCKKGQQQKIDYTNEKGQRVFTEPIGKYFDIFKLKQENKKKFGG
jgi:hypothetical protein